MQTSPEVCFQTFSSPGILLHRNGILPTRLQLLPVSTLSPKQRLTYCLSPKICLVQTFHITGVVQCVVSCACHLSLVFLRFIQVVACISSLFLFLDKYIPVYNMLCFVCPSQWPVLSSIFLSFPLYSLPHWTI